MPKTKESDVVGSVLETLGRRPDLCRVWRQNTGCLRDCWGRPVRFGCVGAGDISGLLIDGRRLEIECKSTTGKQRPEQEAFQAMIQRFGGVYLLVRSVEEAVRGVEDAIENKRLFESTRRIGPNPFFGAVKRDMEEGQ